MKLLKLQVILLALIMAFSSAYAQDEDLDNLNFEESEPAETGPSYSSLAGGFLGTFSFINLDDLQSKIDQLGFADKGKVLTTPIFLLGGEGFVSVPLFSGFNVGFIGMSGSQVSDEDTLGRQIELSLGLTGITLNWGYVLFSHFAINPGIMGGWGSLQIETWRNVNDRNWDDVLNPNGDRTTNYLDRARTSFFFVQPHVNFEYAVAPYLMFRLNASYNLTFSGDDNWEYNRGAKINNIPSKLNANAFNLQLGVFLGLFSY